MAAGLGVLWLVLTASPGSAAPYRFGDPVGDGVAEQSSLDIVWVEFRTTGTGSGRQYVPWDLMVTMRLNNVPMTSAGVVYGVQATVGDCSQFQLSYAPPESAGGVPLLAARVATYCGVGDDSRPEVRFERRGASLIWRVPISSLPGQMRIGATYTDIGAYAEVGDPFFGGTGSMLGSDAGADTLRAPDPWVMR